MSKTRLLLISSSQVYGRGYLDHCIDEIKTFLKDEIKEILFIPYAKKDTVGYTKKVKERLEPEGFTIKEIHSFESPIQAIEEAKAVFVGGGNTFLLLNELYKNKLVVPLREKILNGMFYLGSSAGSNIAGQTIKTTNDMPIIYPPSLDSLGVVPFQINPHYFDPLPEEFQAGETREERIREFHEWNAMPVVGLRQKAILLVDGKTALLKGGEGAKVFIRGREPREFQPGENLNSLFD